MSHTKKLQFRSTFYLFPLFILFLISMTTSCTKSETDPKPPALDSLYLINSLSIYQGGDSTYQLNMQRNSYTIDSVANQIIQRVYNSGTDSCIIAYQYDNLNRLQAVTYSTQLYPFQNIVFQYDVNNNLQKAVFTGFDGSTVENEFSSSVVNGKQVITQYDTLSSNIGKGIYFTLRPAITQYTFNASGKLINQYLICSELYNGGQPFGDTVENNLSYDVNNHLTQITNYTSTLDGENNSSRVNETMQIVRDVSALTPVNDLAVATLRNLNWLATSDYVGNFANASNVQYTYVPREEPLKSTYDDYGTYNYTATYQNNFDASGLLTQATIVSVEHNIYNPGTTKHESHYYAYTKIKI